MEIIWRKVQEDKSVWFNSPQVEVRGIFADQYIKSCILGIHLDAQLLNRMKIIRQRESKKDYKLIYWCTSMTGIYTCFHLVQICSRAYNLIVKSQQSQALSERRSICTEPKKENSLMFHPSHFHICDFPSVIFHQPAKSKVIWGKTNELWCTLAVQCMLLALFISYHLFYS